LPLQVVKAYTPIDEFEKWQAYFYIRRSKNEKQDYYLASIAHLVACTMGGSKTKLEEHLIKFTPANEKYNPDASKNAWFTALGITPQ